MKIYNYYLLAAFALFLFSCEKETTDLSIVTVPCTIELQGDATALVALGTPYEEPGYEAFEGEKDLTNTVVVSGTLDTNVPGRYTLRYTVKNSAGAITVEKRTVIVFDPASPTGFYKVSSESYRNAPPSNEYASEPLVLVYQEESGAYFVSDLYGGYYAVGRERGPSFATGGSIKINKQGIVSLVASRTTPWGDKFSKVEGTYDSETQIFNIVVDWESGYTFYLILIKQ